jgi:hypothetical protein
MLTFVPDLLATAGALGTPTRNRLAPEAGHIIPGGSTAAHRVAAARSYVAHSGRAHAPTTRAVASKHNITGRYLRLGFFIFRTTSRTDDSVHRGKKRSSRLGTQVVRINADLLHFHSTPYASESCIGGFDLIGSKVAATATATNTTMSKCHFIFKSIMRSRVDIR